MAGRRKQPDYTRVRNGKVEFVSGSWARLRETAPSKATRRSGRCPECGAKIIFVKNRIGGRVVLEVGMGRRRVKHLCAHVGEGLSRKKSETTLDLFERLEVLCPSCGAYGL